MQERCSEIDHHPLPYCKRGTVENSVINHLGAIFFGSNRAVLQKNRIGLLHHVNSNRGIAGAVYARIAVKGYRINLPVLSYFAMLKNKGTALIPKIRTQGLAPFGIY